ncbi:MAG: hypothetical protein R3C49_04095 [Planctomycetaceae bacterium]
MNSVFSTILTPVAGLLMLAGCGGGSDGPALYEVSGTVTWNGAPLSQGDIIFRASDGKGNSYAAKIANGAYTAKCEPGPKQVEITSIQEVPGKTREDNPGEIVAVTEQVIPEQFNTKTGLKTDVAANDDNVADFDLTK